MALATVGPSDDFALAIARIRVVAIGAKAHSETEALRSHRFDGGNNRLMWQPPGGRLNLLLFYGFDSGS